ncbi:diguanylate cyclase [Magnetospirillum sp. SS-4]|uniref:sensor domain-containing diguanylate cyclase n=1 Tax=Magnetospirillum sp. SS-4 TaxID=2681465 RepID=UPI00137CC5AA|nr:diguanylate cyclase [Magnetospirillum sp. SS-4]CAA7620821.1 FOG: GGDEF domain [Magnetospirillum sp. SS-4]
MTTEDCPETAAERRRKGPRFGANFMNVLEVSRDLVCLCADGVIIDVNSAGRAMLGAESPDQLIGRGFCEMVGGDYAQVLDELLLLREIEVAAIPAQVRRLSGRVFDAEIQIHPARELGGVHAVVTVRDISRQGRLARTARESEDRFRVLVEKSMHLIAQCHGGRIVYLNAAGLKMLGIESSADLGAMMVADMFHGDYRSIFAADLSALLAEPGMLPVRLAHRDGSAFDAQVLVTPLPSKGVVPEYMIEARDISSHLRAVAALRRMNDTLESQVAVRTRELARERSLALEAKGFVESLLEAVPNPLWWKGLDGRFRGYNRAFREIHGLGPTEWIGRTTAETLPPAFVGSAVAADARVLGGEGAVQYEARLDFIDGRIHDVVVSKTAWRSRPDRPEGVIGVMLDITERKRMEAELRRMATTDALTGISNRRHFMSLAAAEVERARRHSRPLAALMLDIDHFKRINDTFGHPVGDEAIKAMAAACTQALRGIDHLGRLGGEEFAVILPDTDQAAAMAVAERIRAAVAAIVVATGRGDAVFTTSIGVAALNDADASAEPLLSRADAALYAAKTGGRNKVVAG